MPTPDSMRASATSLPGSSSDPTPLAADITDIAPLTPPEPSNPLEGIPDLQTFVTEDEDDKIKALKLVTDTIAQMRQTASRILIFHPVNVALYIGFMAVSLNYLYTKWSDYGIVATTGGGISMAALLIVRWLTGGYIFMAEEYAEPANVIKVLDNADVLVTRFGDEIIGSVIVGWTGVAPGKASTSPKAGQRDKRRKYKAEIRGWAVRLRYRGKGIGADLLEEAVKLAKSKGADSVAFADDHASEFFLWLSFWMMRGASMRDFTDSLTSCQTRNVCCGDSIMRLLIIGRRGRGINFSSSGMPHPRARRDEDIIVSSFFSSHDLLVVFIIVAPVVVGLNN